MNQIEFFDIYTFQLLLILELESFVLKSSYIFDWLYFSTWT